MTDANTNCIALVDHVKDIVLDLVDESGEELKHYCLSLVSNLIVGAVAFIPSLAVAASGLEFAQKIAASGSELTLISIATMVAPMLVALLVAVVCYLGILRVFIKIARGLDVSLLEVLSGFRKIWSLTAVSVVLAPVVITGLLLFMLPGLYVLMRASLVPILIIDQNAGPLAAIKRSFQLTADRNSDLFLLVAASVMANYLVLAISLMAGGVLPALAPMIMVPFFLVSQFLVAKFYVSANPSATQVWEMLYQFKLNRA